MPRDFKIILEDILESIARIEKYTMNVNFEEFSENQEKIDAILRNLEIIGEATKLIPKNLKIIWDIVTEKLPELKKNLKTLE